jgi:hypothetical protein
VICTIPFGHESFSQDNSDIYYRTAGYPPRTRDVTFVRIAGPEKYMTDIDLDDLRDSIGVSGITRFNSNNYIRYIIDYIGEDNNPNRAHLSLSIFNSRENAELFALDMIGISNAWFVHAADREEDIDLGDNAWLNGSIETTGGYRIIRFTRNNVYISLSLDFSPNPESTLNFCKKIDRYIVEHSICDSPDSVPVPHIISTKVVSTGILNDKQQITLSANAIDPAGGTLYYRLFNKAFNFCTDGIIKTSINEKETSRILWVMNERLLVASKEIFN